MKGYYLSERPQLSITNSIKAMSDADTIFENAGLTKVIPTCVAYPDWDKKHRLYRYLCLHKFVKACNKLDNEYIFIQYPTNLGNVRLFPRAIKKLSSKNRLIFLVNNLNGIKYESKKLDKIDKYVLRKGYKVISHNKYMSEYLNNEYRIPSNRLMDLDFLYYLTDSINIETRKKDKRVVYAGNLDDSDTFINRYKEDKIDAILSIYGESEKKELLNSSNIKYCGKFPNDIVNLKLKGSFGLVWGGTSIDSFKGNLGTYAKINSPHKASLYIIARLPIITSYDSAIAELVERYKIGFLVKSIREIPNKIENLTEKQYEEMVSNIALIADRISTGKNLLKLIKQIVD